MQFIQTLHKYVKKFVFFSFWCNRRKQGLLSAETILTWRDKRCSLQQSEFHHRLPPATGELKGLNGLPIVLSSIPLSTGGISKGKPSLSTQGRYAFFKHSHICWLTTLAGWRMNDPLPNGYVTKLVTSSRKRSQAVLAVCGCTHQLAECLSK